MNWSDIAQEHNSIEMFSQVNTFFMGDSKI